MSNGNTSPYGDLFDLPEVEEGTQYQPSEQWKDINWENPSSQEMATIQQSPELQSIYLRKLLKAGGAMDPFETEGFLGKDPGDMIYRHNKMRKYGEGRWKPEKDFIDFNMEDIEKFAGYGLHNATEEEYQNYLQYFLDYQQGLKRLHGGDVGIDALSRELGLLEEGVTGKGGLMQQKGTMADILGQNIATRRGAYVPKEKVSRYGKLGGGVGVDPTAGYLSGVESDVSSYESSIGGINKSISDILYGTGEGSIHDVYGDYGDIVKGSLFDGDDPWFV